MIDTSGERDIYEVSIPYRLATNVKSTASGLIYAVPFQSLIG